MEAIAERVSGAYPARCAQREDDSINTKSDRCCQAMYSSDEEPRDNSIMMVSEHPKFVEKRKPGRKSDKSSEKSEKIHGLSKRLQRLIVAENHIMRKDLMEATAKRVPCSNAMVYETIYSAVVETNTRKNNKQGCIELFISNCLPGYKIDYSRLIDGFRGFDLTSLGGKGKNLELGQIKSMCQIDRSEDDATSHMRITHAIRIKKKDDKAELPGAEAFTKQRLMTYITVTSGKAASMQVPSQEPRAWCGADFMIPSPALGICALNPQLFYGEAGYYDKMLQERTTRLATYTYIHTSPDKLDLPCELWGMKNGESETDTISFEWETKLDEYRKGISASLPSRINAAYVCPPAESKHLFQSTYCEELRRDLYVYEAEIIRSTPDLKMHLTDATGWSNFYNCRIEYQQEIGQRYWDTGLSPKDIEQAEIIVQPASAVRLVRCIKSPLNL